MKAIELDMIGAATSALFKLHLVTRDGRYFNAAQNSAKFVLRHQDDGSIVYMLYSEAPATQALLSLCLLLGDKVFTESFTRNATWLAQVQPPAGGWWGEYALSSREMAVSDPTYKEGEQIWPGWVVGPIIEAFATALSSADVKLDSE
ncbi:MAG TPA: hypothetical protein GX509_09790 [Firmicutes bacterium]|nr:hypothetical protein [Bacillota bacterium]HHY99015.1 hypothetical protein [Bacillota bacterium]